VPCVLFPPLLLPFRLTGDLVFSNRLLRFFYGNGLLSSTFSPPPPFFFPTRASKAQGHLSNSNFDLIYAPLSNIATPFLSFYIYYPRTSSIILFTFLKRTKDSSFFMQQFFSPLCSVLRMVLFFPKYCSHELVVDIVGVATSPPLPRSPLICFPLSFLVILISTISFCRPLSLPPFSPLSSHDQFLHSHFR